MGRKPLIEEHKHPLYFKMSPLQGPALPQEESGPAQEQIAKTAESFMEQVLEGLSDACMLVDRISRVLYANSVAKSLLSPRKRIRGRKLDAVLADRRLSMLAADVYHTGKPTFSSIEISLPGERWRDKQAFHISLVPLWLTPTRRLVRIALSNSAREKAPAGIDENGARTTESETPSPPAQCSESMTRMRNPLTIVQGYLENLLDGAIKDPTAMRQTFLTMRKHTLAIEKLLEGCQK